MLLMRPAAVGDRAGIAAMVTDRTARMAERGLRSFRGTAEAVAEQAGADDCPVWVLVEDGTIVGCTTAFDQSPAWAFTEEERSRPALFLASKWSAAAGPVTS
jgi:hypothetical protein